MQDIGGVRAVRDFSLDEQDTLVRQIMSAFPGAVKDDRRDGGQLGYRAVHVIVKQDDCWIEVQVRTEMQNLWAQVSELIGDILGSGIKYGPGPDDGPLVTRASKVLIEGSRVVAVREQLTQEILRLNAETDEIERLGIGVPEAQDRAGVLAQEYRSWSERAEEQIKQSRRYRVRFRRLAKAIESALEEEE
jgi:hypothetical protein